MKTLKKVGIRLLSLVVILSLISLLLPRRARVQRSRVITAAPATVFEQVNTLRNWEKWSPWHRLDPQMKLTYSGPAAGAGARYDWTSTDRNVGSGYLTITRSLPARRLEADMNFLDNGTARCAYLFEPVPTGTKVTWTMESDLGYNPAGRYLCLLMNQLVGPDFDKGLTNLQEVAGGTLVSAR